MIQLRPYQQEAVDAAIHFIKNNKKGQSAIIDAATAAGKSLIIGSICRELNKLGHKVLVLQPGIEILEQNIEKLKLFGFNEVQVFSAAMNSKEIGSITLGTIKSVYNHLDKFIEFGFDTIIVDECHEINAKGSGQYITLIETVNTAVLGLTASAYRQHTGRNHFSRQPEVISKVLTRTRPKVFHKFVYSISTKKLYEENYLSRLEYIYPKKIYDQKEIKLNTTGAEYDDISLLHYNYGFGMIGEVVSALEENKIREKKLSTIVFVKSIKEANELTDTLIEAGYNAKIITGTTDKEDRKLMIQEFKEGKFQVVVNVGVLTTGFDYPDLDCVVLARPTQSITLYQQMVGRALRKGKNPTSYIIDIVRNSKKFGRVETFELREWDKPQKVQLYSEVGQLTGVDIITGL